MQKIKLEFPGSQGQLAGLLEQQNQPSKGMVLFAHCFTCGHINGFLPVFGPRCLFLAFR